MGPARVSDESCSNGQSHWRLTITNTVAFLVTVVALDGGTVRVLHLLLGAVLGDVTNLVAIRALGLTNGDDITGVLQASQDLLVVLGPTLLLGLALGLVGEAVIHGVLLAEVALQVHIG